MTRSAKEAERDEGHDDPPAHALVHVLGPDDADKLFMKLKAIGKRSHTKVCVLGAAW